MHRSSAYRKGLSQIRQRSPTRFTSYRDGAIVGQTLSPTFKTTVEIPDWTAWGAGGLIGLLFGFIIGRR